MKKNNKDLQTLKLEEDILQEVHLQEHQNFTKDTQEILEEKN
jgi:hypothetical protein